MQIETAGAYWSYLYLFHISQVHNSIKILRICIKGHPYMCSTSDQWSDLQKPGHHNGTANHSETLQNRPRRINIGEDESISHACFKSVFTQNNLKTWKSCKSADLSYSVVSLSALWKKIQKPSGSLTTKSSFWHEICLQDRDNILQSFFSE